MRIRRAKATDEEALASIRRNAILVLAVSAMSMEQAEQWSARAVADRIVRAIRDHTVWVAVEGAVIGWVEVDQDRVAALYVSPSCSRRGVGSALLARAETSIQSSGYATAWSRRSARLMPGVRHRFQRKKARCRALLSSISLSQGHAVLASQRWQRRCLSSCSFHCIDSMTILTSGRCFRTNHGSTG